MQMKEQLMSNETVRRASQKQIQDIIATIIGAIPSLSFSEAQGVIGNKGVITNSVKNSFKQFLKKSIPGAWAVVTIGGDSKEVLLGKLKSRKVKMWARTMIENPAFVTLPEPTTIGLIIKKVADLGFSQKPTIEEILEAGQEQGLLLCHPEVGPRLWLDNDCEDGSYFVAMDPIHDHNNTFSIFCLSFANKAEQHTKKMYHWLCADQGLKRKWDLSSKIIFTMPTKEI